MTARNFQSIHITGLEIECLLSLSDARCRFECHSERYGCTIGYTSVHATGAILDRPRIWSDWVIMLRTFHRSSLESVTEFDATYSRDCKHGMRDLRLNTIPERLAITWVYIRDGTLYHGTQTIPFSYCLIDSILPLFLIRYASKFHDTGIHCRTWGFIQHRSIFQNLLCHNSCRYNRESETSREMTASSRVLTVIPFERSRKIRMARTRHGSKQRIIRRMSVRIPERHRKRCASRMPLKHTTDDTWLISLDTRGSSLRTAFPPENILHEIIFRQFQTGWHSVQDNSYEFTMRLSENRHSVFSSECIHNRYRLFFYPSTGKAPSHAAYYQPIAIF